MLCLNVIILNPNDVKEKKYFSTEEITNYYPQSYNRKLIDLNLCISQMGLYALYLNYVFEAIRFKLMKKLLFKAVTLTHTFTNKVIIVSALIMFELVINNTSFTYNVCKLASFIENI